MYTNGFRYSNKLEIEGYTNNNIYDDLEISLDETNINNIKLNIKTVSQRFENCYLHTLFINFNKNIDILTTSKNSINKENIAINNVKNNIYQILGTLDNNNDIEKELIKLSEDDKSIISNIEYI